jgi:uncharacterized protein (UPF0332 family)
MTMSLEDLYKQGSLKQHRTSAREIKELLKVVDRDLKDAEIKSLSTDRRFATAYNAVLELATISLYCKGYRPHGSGQHYTVFQAVKETMGADSFELAEYFNACRVKRNVIDYDRAGSISEIETEKLLKEARHFREIIVHWLQSNHPEFFM